VINYISFDTHTIHYVDSSITFSIYAFTQSMCWKLKQLGNEWEEGRWGKREKRGKDSFIFSVSCTWDKMLSHDFGVTKSRIFVLPIAIQLALSSDLFLFFKSNL